MTLRILSIQHDRQGLAEVERVVGGLDSMTRQLRDTPGVESVLPLSTCNRVELIIDAPECSTRQLTDAVASAAPPQWSEYEGTYATVHLFRVCAGLESMVVGEREIAGQVRRALGEVQDAGLASTSLTMVVEEALRTSRRVGRETTLAAAGRSVVSVALDTVAQPDWEQTRVLLVGTGAFAGSCVAALRARGATQIHVHSASGRAEDFAMRHHLVAAQDLRDELRQADLVVTCRGTGVPVITPADIPSGARLNILDLSLARDVDPDVAALPGVRLVDLEQVQQAVSPKWAADTEHAGRIVAQGVAEAHAKLHARVLDPAVVTLRQSVLELVADEVGRLPQGRPLELADAERALRRLATRLLHVPSSRAKIAAASGRTDEYLSAMSELYGIGGPDQMVEAAECPATGLQVADLAVNNAEPSVRTPTPSPEPEQEAV